MGNFEKDSKKLVEDYEKFFNDFKKLDKTTEDFISALKNTSVSDGTIEKLSAKNGLKIINNRIFLIKYDFDFKYYEIILIRDWKLFWIFNIKNRCKLHRIQKGIYSGEDFKDFLIFTSLTECKKFLDNFHEKIDKYGKFTN